MSQKVAHLFYFPVFPQFLVLLNSTKTVGLACYSVAEIAAPIPPFLSKLSLLITLCPKVRTENKRCGITFQNRNLNSSLICYLA